MCGRIRQSRGYAEWKEIAFRSKTSANVLRCSRATTYQSPPQVIESVIPIRII